MHGGIDTRRAVSLLHGQHCTWFIAAGLLLLLLLLLSWDYPTVHEYACNSAYRGHWNYTTGYLCRWYPNYTIERYMQLTLSNVLEELNISGASFLPMDNAGGSRKCVFINNVSTETYRVSYLNDWIIKLLKKYVWNVHKHIRDKIESQDCCVLTYFLFFMATFRFRRVTKGIQAALHLRIFIVFREWIID